MGVEHSGSINSKCVIYLSFLQLVCGLSLIENRHKTVQNRVKLTTQTCCSQSGRQFRTSRMPCSVISELNKQ